MPVSTSPYQQNDYRAASEYQPYRLNTQQVAQTAMALDQFWKIGAARVKSAYDSVLNLNLTSEENKQVRDQFMQDAQKQLDKLATQDLSTGDVQRQGFNIFKPIFQDKAMMQDDYLTKLRSDIYSEADKFRRDQKTNGSGFHMDNLAYALKGFQGFNSRTSRNQIEDIYEGAKDSQYVPYYDDTKEKMEIMKACKGNKLSNTVNNGPYLETYSDKSLYESKLYGCLEGALSQRSRQQNRISASVRYGNDYQAVKQDYIDTASERKSFYTGERAKINAKKEALSKIAGNEDQVAELTGQIKMIDDNIEKLGTDIDTYNSWTPDFLKRNYEDLAANAYFKRVNHSFAQAFSITDIEDSKKADPIYITHYVQDQLNRRAYADNQAAIELENLKFQHKLLAGEDENGKKIDNLTRFKRCAEDPNCRMSEFLTEAYKEEATTSGKIEGQINTLTAQKFDIIKDLKNDPFVSGLIKGIEVGDVTAFNEDAYKKMWSVLNEYTVHADNADPNKQKIVDVVNKLLEIDNRKSVLGGILEDAKNDVSKNNPQIRADYEKKSSEILASAKPVKLFDGSVIDARRAASIIKGTDSELHVVPYTQSQSGPGTTPSITTYPIYNKEGKQVGWFENNKDVIEKHNFINNSTTGNYKSLLDKYLGESTAVQKMGLATGNLFEKGSPAMRDIESMFGNYLQADNNDEIKYTSVGGLDPVTGKLKLQATGKDGPISAKKMRDALAKTGVGTSVYNEIVDDQTLEITLPSATGIVQEPKYSDVLRLQLNYLEKKAPTLPPNGVVLQVGKDKTGNSYSIRVKKKIGSTAPEYTLIANGVESPLYNTRQIDEKENILIQLDSLLNGIDKKK